MPKKIVVEGRFVGSETEFFGQIEIDSSTGLITRVGSNLGKPYYFFDEKCMVFPAFGDIHVHAREDETKKHNYKETYKTTEKAALNGGTAFVAVMPNTPNPLVSLKQLNWHKAKTNNLRVSFLNYVGIGKNTVPLKKSVPYKVYTGPSIGSLFFKNKKELEKALKKYAFQHVSFHVEDFSVIQKNKDKEDHAKRRPVECVENALNYVLELIEEFNIKAKLCHWNINKKSFNKIKRHKKRGFNTTIEVSPLHLFYDYDTIKKKPWLWPFVQMNPSIQGKKHRIALIKGLKKGFIDFLATDHAPHTLNEKLKNFVPPKNSRLSREEYYLKLLKQNKKKAVRLAKLDSISGTPQLDTYSLFCCWLIKKHGFKPKDISRVASFNPGKFFNQFLEKKSVLGKGFGELKKGFQGSFTVLRLDKTTIVERKNLKTKCGWSPFEGITFPGKLEALILKGKKV